MSLLSVMKNNGIENLKKYFKKEPSIILAFLFGSFAKGFETEESDFDIAVYLKDTKKENEIWSKSTEIIKREIDLVCLNETSATLVSNVFKTGVPLAIKDRDLYWNLYLEKSLESEDFLEFSKDFFKIYKKAKSLIPEEKNRILERLQFLDSELKEIREFKKLTFKEYEENKTKRRNIERWTENIINATIDIAKIILASEKKRMPKTYAEALFNFGIFAGLTEEEANKLSSFSNLRNILAYEYLDILYQKIQNFIKESQKLYKEIFGFLGKYL